METILCIEAHKGECEGQVELRESLTGTGTAIARCDKHWDDRLKWQQEHNKKYPDSVTPPSWYDEEYAGEVWDEDA